MSELSAPSTDDQIKAGLVAILYRRLPAALMMSVGISLLFVILLAQSLPLQPLIIWLLALYAVSGARALVWNAHRRRAGSPREATYWVTRFRVGAGAAALTWSVGTAFLLAGADAQQTLMLVITILAVSAVAVATLGSDFPSLLIFISLALLPVAVLLLVHPERLVQVAGLAVSTSMFTLYGAGYRISDDLQKLLRTELEMSTLAIAESQARAAAEAANADLRVEVLARQRAQEEALANDARLRVALESARTYAWEYTFDPPRLQVTGGPELDPAHGLASDAHVGDFREQVHPDDRPILRAALERARLGEGFHSEFRLRVRGSWRWQAAHGRLTHKGGGPRLIGVVHDVTRRKAEQEELLEAKERAEAGSRAKSQFLATMSHEIRTPLNGIVGMLELLHDTELTDAQRSMAIGASRSCDVLLAVINDILDLSKIEANRLELESIPYDPRAVAADVTALLVEGAQRKGLTLHCRVAWDAPSAVMGDPQRLRQVLINLVANAVKFTAHGEVELSVEGQLSEAGAVRVRVAVRDTGIGLTDEQIGRLFEPFSQADMSTSRKYGGSGLGLAISRQLIELMGGAIGVSSVPGMGSTFFFEVAAPVAEPVGGTASPPLVGEPRPTASASAEARPPQDRDMTANRRILLVEDNPINQQVASAMLRKLGCNVTVASGGEEGVRLGVSGRFDLILMDCQMPEVDGLQAARRIRAQQGAGTRTPIVALTANALQGDRERCLEAGMDDYLTKPLTSAPLRAMLERWLASRATPVPFEVVSRADSITAALDHQALAETRDLDDDGTLLLELVGVFYTDGARLVSDVRTALEAGAVDKLAFASHTLKSCSWSVGARDVREACAGLEHTTRQERRLPAPADVEALERAFEAACEALEVETGVTRPTAMA